MKSGPGLNSQVLLNVEPSEPSCYEALSLMAADDRYEVSWCYLRERKRDSGNNNQHDTVAGEMVLQLEVNIAFAKDLSSSPSTHPMKPRRSCKLNTLPSLCGHSETTLTFTTAPSHIIKTTKYLEIESVSRHNM